MNPPQQLRPKSGKFLMAAPWLPTPLAGWEAMLIANGEHQGDPSPYPPKKS